MSDTTDRMMCRQWQIVSYLLQQTGYTSTSQIQDYLKQQGIDTELRTVQRDLNTLQKVLPLECRTDDKPYGWRWRRLDNAKRHNLSLTDAALVCLIESELKDVIPADILIRLSPLFLKTHFVIGDTALSQKIPNTYPKHTKTQQGRGVVPMGATGGIWCELQSWLKNLKEMTAKQNTIALDNEDKTVLKELATVLKGSDLNLLVKKIHDLL